MQTGTLSGNTCSAYGAPATITGTTSQTVASGHCYLLTLTGTDNVGNAATHHHDRQGRHDRPERADRRSASPALTQRLLPRRRHDRLLQGRHRRRLHRHRLGRHRRRHRRRGLQLRRDRRQPAGRNVAGAYTFTGISPTGTGSVTATNNAGLTGASASFTAQTDSTAPAGGAFTANGTAATGGGSSQLSQQRHHADDQLPHRLHRDADRSLRPRHLDADDPVGDADRPTPAAPTAHPARSPARPRRPSRAATATCSR